MSQVPELISRGVIFGEHLIRDHEWNRQTELLWQYRAMDYSASRGNQKKTRLSGEFGTRFQMEVPLFVEDIGLLLRDSVA